MDSGLLVTRLRLAVKVCVRWILAYNRDNAMYILSLFPRSAHFVCIELHAAWFITLHYIISGVPPLQQSTVSHHPPMSYENLLHFRILLPYT